MTNDKKQPEGVYSFDGSNSAIFTFNLGHTKALDLVKKLRAAQEAVTNIQKEMMEYASEASNLPNAFKIQSVGDNCGMMLVKAKASDIRLDKPCYNNVHFNAPSKDAYETIRDHHNVVQIINSGLLTKEEKRRVFNLPPEDKIDKTWEVKKPVKNEEGDIPF